MILPEKYFEDIYIKNNYLRMALLLFSAVATIFVITAKILLAPDQLLALHMNWILLVPVILFTLILIRKLVYIFTGICIAIFFFFSMLIKQPGSIPFIVIAAQVLSVIALCIIVLFIITRTKSLQSEFHEHIQISENESAYKEEVVEALLKAVDAKDSYTYKHSQRVAYYSRILASSAGIPADETNRIYLAAKLHDIGKIGMKDNILNKSEKLSDMEYIEAKEHVVVGARIAQNLNYLQDIVPMIAHHHERYDGKGYPEQLKGENIPVGSRVIAICDSFDAMTSDREYRKGMQSEEAIEQLMSNMGTQYDPSLCVIFADLIRNNGILHPDIKKEK